MIDMQINSDFSIHKEGFIGTVMHIHLHIAYGCFLQQQ